MQGCFLSLMTTPLGEATPCPTQGKNLKPIYMGLLQNTKTSHQLGRAEVYLWMHQS
jgi:hypothetical protein